jgi:hypothetical protein
VNTYSIKIALRGISPMIWRRLRIDGNTSIADLHYIIQIAMGWDDDYLHHFHIHGIDYGLSRAGCGSFRHDAELVFVDDFTFDVGDRFTYTYNYFEFWLCDIRIEAIEPSSMATPRCFGGSGRKGDRDYYKVDEVIAGSKVIEKVARAGKSVTVGDIRRWLEGYDSIRFSRPSINKQLKEPFPDLR